MVRCVIGWSVVTAIAGCATVEPRADFERAADYVEQATGHRTPFAADDDAAVSAKVASLLDDGLTATESVQVALLNNPSLVATFMSIGMARADVVQSGLLSNPSLGVSMRLPSGGGVANIEANLAQNIVDLWQIPVRKRVAQRALEQAILDAARQAAWVAADVKIAYFAAVAADEVLVIADDNLALAEELLEVTRARQEAGAAGELDVNLVRGTALAARANRENARLEAHAARRRLATLLGLVQRAEDLELIDSLPVGDDLGVDAEQIVTVAHQWRLDLRAAEQNVEEALARVEQQRLNVFPNVQVGLSFEREARRGQRGRKLLSDAAKSSIANQGLTVPEIQTPGERRLSDSSRIATVLGPSVSATLPIWDQNQAQIAKAEFEYEQAAAMQDSLERSITQEARQAVDRAATASTVARLFRDEVQPQAERTLMFARESYAAGKASILIVIDAQRTLLETRRLHVAALQEAAAAGADLERVTARPVAELRDAVATQPAEMGPVGDKQ